MGRKLAIVILCALAAYIGCRGIPQPLTPPDALPTAQKLPVGQLVFHSDFDLGKDHRMIRQLTFEREDICNTLGLPPSNEPIDVFLFRDTDRYREFLARHFPNVPSRRAFFLESDSRLSVYAHWSDRMAEDLRHEVAHGYLHSVVPGLPLWLDEGLAEYFEVPHGQQGLNQPHVELLAELAKHNGWRPDMRRLERLTDAAQMQQSDYAESWAWVYLFLHSPPERRELLTQYLADLRETSTREPLSIRLAKEAADPEKALVEYLATLNATTQNSR
jgi:hypothetical protein